MTEARIELGRVWKARNQNEGRYVPSASALGLTESGDGSIICDLCRRLVVAEPDLTHVSAFRGGTPVFERTPIKRWTCSRARESVWQPVRFMKWQPMPDHLKGR